MDKRILIVEDDSVLLQMYAKKFTKDGFEVIEAVDGIEALDKLEHTDPKPKAILLDIMLPRLDGFEVLKKIKADEKTRDIPVFLSTNLGGGAQDREKGIQLGAVDYLIKSDFTPAEIVGKVKEVVE